MMNPHKPNSGVSEVQEVPDQGDASSQVCQKGSSPHQDASTRAKATKAAFQLFMQVFAAVLPDADDESLRRIAGTLTPEVRHLLGLLEGFRQAKPSDMTGPPCNSCQQRNSCEKPCESLNAHLPSPDAGKLHDERTGGLDFDEIKALRGSSEDKFDDERTSRGDRGAFRGIKKVESLDVMRQYEPCWDLLTHKQQEAVRLYHAEGKNIGEVAGILGRSPSTVSGLLKRAQKKKEEYNAQKRKQELDLQYEIEAKRREF
jgi:predicted DNA-binding protein YlxM (UPF0122 family)